MKGSDLKCPECGAGAADVSPDYDLDGTDLLCPVASWAIEWDCTNGHRHITGTSQAGQGGALTSMRIRQSAKGDP